MAPANGIEVRRSSSAGDAPVEIPDFDGLLGTSSGRRILCRACRHPVTSDADRTTVEGRHVHRRTNPFGIDFEFACFGRAPGAAVVGEPTAEHTWFDGHTWSYVVCRGCGSHLGWFFQGKSAFFGLIRNRLEVEEDEEQG